MNFLLVFVGLFIGLVAGLIPGLHSNTIIAALASIGLNNEDFAVLVISIFPAHMIASFIPSIFFGVPDEGTAISVLPGQRLVQEGKGIIAVKIVLFSCFFAGLCSLGIFMFSKEFFSITYAFLKPYIKYIVLLFSIIFLWRSKQPLLAAVVFILSGSLGYYALNIGIYDPFLPLFSGMFAMGAILNYKAGSMPKQKEKQHEVPDVRKFHEFTYSRDRHVGHLDLGFIKYVLLGVIFGMFADLLPGISSASQVAAFMTIFFPLNTISFLASIAAISVSAGMFSLATVTSIGKSRVGATAWLSKFIDINANLLPLLVFFMVSMVLSIFVLYILRKKICVLASIDFSRFNLVLAFYLAALVILLNGFYGLVIFCIASALGWLTIKLDVERTTMMGAVIIPTLILLL